MAPLKVRKLSNYKGKGVKEEARQRQAELIDRLKVSILIQRLNSGSGLDEAGLSAAFGLAIKTNFCMRTE